VKITEEDVALLKRVVVDKTTGLAMKVDEQGQVVPLDEYERERVAFIIIELCLYILAKQISSISEGEVESLRTKIRENFGDTDDDLLPLLKVANNIANKLIQGQINNKTINKYVRALATSKNEPREDGDDGDGDINMDK